MLGYISKCQLSIQCLSDCAYFLQPSMAKKHNAVLRGRATLRQLCLFMLILLLQMMVQLAWIMVTEFKGESDAEKVSTVMMHFFFFFFQLKQHWTKTVWQHFWTKVGKTVEKQTCYIICNGITWIRLMKGLNTAVMFCQVCVCQSVMPALCKWAQAAVTQELSTSMPLLDT